MSEVKRRLSETESNGHLSKRQALDVLSEDGPLTQEDVVYFQKELIWRQMKLYKKQYQLINSQLNVFKKQQENDKNKISHLVQWYKQGLSGVTVPEGVTVDESLLVKLDDDKDDELNTIRDSFIAVLSGLKQSGVKDVDVQLKLDHLHKEVIELTKSNELLKSSERQLISQVKNLESQVLELNKIMERSNSKTLVRVSGDPKKEEEVKQEEDTDLKELLKQESVNNEEFEKITIELKELKEVNASLTKQINSEISLSSNLRKELNNVSLRLLNLKDEDLKNSTEYQTMKLENSNLNEEVSELRLKEKQYFTQITELENDKVQYKLNLTQEVTKEKDELSKNLEKLEQDLVRIRANRDDLLSKNSILKNDKSYKELIDEMTSLVNLQQRRIEQLTSEKEGPLINGDATADRDALVKQNSLLLNELKDLEVAFKEAHDLSIKKLTSLLESKSLLNKLNVEKTKADQKYFSTMRVNDSLLQENKLSKLTITKQQELITSLKDVEKKLISKIESMELRIKDLKFLENYLVNENQQFKKKTLELSNKLDAILKHNHKLIELTEKITLEKDLELNLRKQKEIEITKMSSNIKSLETLNQKYRSNLAGAVLQEEQEQVNALRAMVKCSVCSKNWKDTVIKDCGHVFCSDCAQERLAARLRRCPTCNKPFSSNDLISIHL